MFVFSFVVATLSLLSSSTSAFVAGPRFGLSNSLSKKSSLYAASEVASKFFNLEELEDKDTAITEIFLHEDGRVDFFETDGPIPLSAEGKWELNGEELNLFITRKFEAGKEESKDTDMGEFDYTVDRSYVGRMSKVGGLLAFEGDMHDVGDNNQDRKVGFFEMIDTTADRLGFEEADK